MRKCWVAARQSRSPVLQKVNNVQAFSRGNSRKIIFSPFFMWSRLQVQVAQGTPTKSYRPKLMLYWNEVIKRQLRELHVFFALKPECSRRFGEMDAEVLQAYSVSSCRHVNEGCACVLFSSWRESGRVLRPDCPKQKKRPKCLAKKQKKRKEKEKKVC